LGKSLFDQSHGFRRLFPSIRRLLLVKFRNSAPNDPMKSPRHVMIIMMAVALFSVIGGPLALLQGVAWVKMAHDFSKTGTLSQAIAKTFDGHHLCPLCKKIVRARASEEKTPVTMKVDKKAEVFIAGTSAAVPVPEIRPFAYGPVPFVLMPERFIAPPVPVPIGRLS
jgi:hypothetical protein